MTGSFETNRIASIAALSSLSFIVDVSTSSSQYSPVFGLSRQPTVFMKVDLPDPEGPMIATSSPARMCRETPRIAWTRTSPILYVRWRL